MNNVWLWITIICLGFFAMVASTSFSQVDRDAQRQKYEIECLNADGRIELILGNGATCVHK